MHNERKAFCDPGYMTIIIYLYTEESDDIPAFNTVYIRSKYVTSALIVRYSSGRLPFYPVLLRWRPLGFRYLSVVSVTYSLLFRLLFVTCPVLIRYSSVLSPLYPFTRGFTTGGRTEERILIYFSSVTRPLLFRSYM